MRSPLFFLLLLFLFHLIALIQGWYWDWAQLDTVMHTLGGFGIGWLGGRMRLLRQDSLLGWTISVLGFVMLIGVLWEFQEYLLDQTIGSARAWEKTQPSLDDTMRDLFCDGFGGALAILMMKLSNSSSQPPLTPPCPPEADPPLAEKGGDI